jgi:hypothetical protein
LRARGGADEGRRVYERGDEPAGVWERHGARAAGAVARRRRCWTGTVARGHRIRARPGGDQGRRREGQSGQAWAWARGPWAREGGSRGRRRGGGIEGGSRGCAGGPVGRGRWDPGLGSSAGEREGERRRCAGNGGRGNSPVRGRPLVVRAERFRGRSSWREQAGVLASWRWARILRGVPRGRGQPRTGRHDGAEGRRQEGGLLSPGNYIPCPRATTGTCAYICI